MFNKKLNTLICLTLLSSTVFGKMMKKDEVLKINPEDYEDTKDDQCPDYSVGNYWYVNRCGFEFYCKDDNCSSVVRNKESNNSTVEFPDANGSMKTYVADFCDWKTVNDDATQCSKETACNSDSDCLSNKCEKKHCVPNDNIKMEKCQNAVHYHILTFRHTVDMTCGKPGGYTCKSNSDCASDNCIDEICKDHDRDIIFDGFNSMLLYSALIIGLLVAACIGCCCCTCGKSKSRSVKGNAAANAV